MHGPGAAYYPLAPEREPSRGIFILTWISFAVVGGILVFIVPRFAEVFDSVDVSLPASTRTLMAVSAVFPYVSPFYLVVAAFASRRLHRFRRADVALILITAAFLAFVVMALFLPLTGGLQGIGRHR